MELDDLKSAWQTLDRRLEQQSALSLHVFRQDKLARAQSKLRPMFWGQVLQILFGVALMIYAAPIWAAHWQEPVLLFCGMIVHAYGLALCVTGSRMLWQIGAVDYAAPVLAIQQQLAQLRSFYLRSSFWLGNAWWVLWAPLLVVVLFIQGEAELQGHGPRTRGAHAEIFGQLWPQLSLITAVGIAGLLAFVWLYRFLRRRKPDAVRRLEDQSSRGIANAHRVLDEIARFESE